MWLKEANLLFLLLCFAV